MDKSTIKHSFMALVYNMLDNNIEIDEKYHKTFDAILNEISNGYEFDDKKTQLNALENLYTELKK